MKMVRGIFNQSLTALATPLPKLTTAQSWHTKSQSVTFVTHARQAVCVRSKEPLNQRSMHAHPRIPAPRIPPRLSLPVVARSGATLGRVAARTLARRDVL